MAVSSEPIKPATRTRHIEYAVRDVTLLASKVAATGKQMLYLNIGDPNKFDFVTPRNMVEAAYQAMLANKNGYSDSSGIKEGVAAVERAAQRKGIRNIRDIFVTTGASEGIEIALTSLAEPGDNILLPSPGYPLYTAVLAKLGVENNPYYLDESDGWQPDVDDIAKKINPRTRAIVVINPNNPTGSVASEQTLQRLVELAIDRDLVIFADEIYDQLLLGDARHTSLAALSDDACVLTFNGLSKSYLAPGFRIGWCIVSGPRPKVAPFDEAMQKIVRARLCANQPLQWTIMPALDGDQQHLVEVKQKLTRRRDLTVERLNAIPGISCVAPQGAFYAFPSIDLGLDDKQFVSDLMAATGVVVVPGSGFGQKPDTQHFRVVFLPDEATLERAYAAIADHVRTTLGSPRQGTLKH